MKRIIVLLVLTFSGLAGFSQSLDDINEMMGKKNFVGARAAIDKYLIDSKNASKPDSWFFKGRIYNALSYDKDISLADAYKMKLEAFDAFKHYQSLDAKDVRLKLENPPYASYLDLYFGLYDLGVNQFNSKDYSSAYESFTKALEVKDFILQKKYEYNTAKLYPLDTALVLNIGTAANLSKNEPEAIRYYKMLTDANVSGKDYQEIYEFLADTYSRNNNSAALEELLPKAKSFYPQSNLWYDLELKAVEKSGDQNALFAKYEDLLSKDPNNFYLLYAYGVEIYNSLYAKDSKVTNEQALKEKLTNIMKQAIQQDKGIDATSLMANHLFNWASDYSTASGLIKGSKPEDVKKRNELKALANKKMDEFIPYGDAVLKYYESQPSLKPTEKAKYRGVAANLSDVYSVKGDSKKAAEYDKKRSAPDKL